MIIHVVEQGDTLQSIAERYETSVAILIQDNSLSEPDNLVIGQCIIIARPVLTYTVLQEDTLEGIAISHNVTLMQLLQNNPYLSDRKYIFPGDRIVISYDKIRSIATHGNTVPYINEAILRKTLPYLTYLSVVNYTATDTGDIISYYEDEDIIQIAKDYKVIPLMFLTTLTIQGEANVRTAYELLLNEEIQDKLIDNILNILKEKGFYGLNLSFEYVSESNLPYIESTASRIANRLRQEGFYSFVTINPNITVSGDELIFQKVDYTNLGNMSDSIVFMNYEWAMNLNPPSPISSIYQLEVYINYLLGTVDPNILSIGLATIGYDWELPYISGLSSVYAITYENAVTLARNEGAVIHFDEESQTPYFTYTSGGTYQTEHIVWFIDARSINALLGLVTEYNLAGTGIWNITVYNTQLWLIINSQFEIIKFEVV